MEAKDFDLAIALQNRLFDELPCSSNNNQEINPTRSLTDPEWELIDPNPDIYVLFDQFNQTFFWNTLSMVEVKWSPRMTLCAGLCCYEGRGRLCSIRLSKPLLNLRPRKDLVETLLHEMIHAYLFVTENNRDRDGHGPEFCKHMRRINSKAGTNITIYHSFHDEVNEMRKHWWRCTGRCRNQPPYFGYVKRAMNRQPSKNDLWWADHQKSCAGDFIKIKEPENYGKKTKKTGDKISKRNTESTLDSTQKTLPFSPLSSTENKGNVLGGFSQERGNSRGIPTSSRLLNLNRNKTKKTQQKSSVTSFSTNKKISSNTFLSKSQSRTREKSENLTKVCQEMRRTGSCSVNENAPAYDSWKVKTKFLTSKTSKVVVFESDDEISDEDIFNPKQNNSKNTKRDMSVLPKPESHILIDDSGFSGRSEAFIDSSDKPHSGVKRKLNSIDYPTTSSRSPLKKKLNLNDTIPTDTNGASNVCDTTTYIELSSDDEANEIPNDNDHVRASTGLSDIDVAAFDDQFFNSDWYDSNETSSSVSCPICSTAVSYDAINTHIDICLNVKAIEESTY